VVGFHQRFERLQALLVIGMPEPAALPERRVGLGSAPAQVAAATDDIPILLRGEAGFVANPANVAPSEKADIGED
jgi:hypothetical protein